MTRDEILTICRLPATPATDTLDGGYYWAKVFTPSRSVRPHTVSVEVVEIVQAERPGLPPKAHNMMGKAALNLDQVEIISQVEELKALPNRTKPYWEDA